MVKRIYVGNLPWSITKIRLEELFSSFGEVEDALVISDKYTGRSRGFGFITFKKDGDADKAISEMNEKEVEGRTLVVKEARPLEKEKERSQEESHFEEKIPVGRDKHSSEREHKERGRKKRKKPEEKIE
ncbi:MAG: RNA-binding protein [Nanoarchaeota archaeon]